MLSKDFNQTKILTDTKLLLSETFPSHNLVALLLGVGIFYAGYQILQEINPPILIFQGNNFITIPDLTSQILLICACLLILGSIFVIGISLLIILFSNKILITDTKVVVWSYFLGLKYKTRVYQSNTIILDFYYKNGPTIQHLKELRYRSRVILKIDEIQIAIRYLYKSLTVEDIQYLNLLSKFNITLSESVNNLVKNQRLVNF